MLIFFFECTFCYKFQICILIIKIVIATIIAKSKLKKKQIRSSIAMRFKFPEKKKQKQSEPRHGRNVNKSMRPSVRFGTGRNGRPRFAFPEKKNRRTHTPKKKAHPIIDYNKRSVCSGRYLSTSRSVRLGGIAGPMRLARPTVAAGERDGARAPYAEREGRRWSS